MMIARNLQRFTPHLFALSAVLALGLGFGAGKERIAEWFYASGFYFIFAAFFLWVTLIPFPALALPKPARAARKAKARPVKEGASPSIEKGDASSEKRDVAVEKRETKAQDPDPEVLDEPSGWTFEAFRTWAMAALREHWVALVLSFGFTVGAFLISPPAFRILADETNLMSVAADMYDHHQFRNMVEVVYYFEGTSDVLATEWDKRPLFYPFLVYAAHSLFGYRPDINGFLVNGVCAFGLFFSFYYYLRLWFTRFYALIGMSLLAAFPLVVLWITSSSFEIPNLFFGVLAFIAFDRFLRDRSGETATFLMGTVLMVSQIRYESALFAICMLPFVPFVLKRKDWPTIGYRALLIPLLFLPVVWQRRLSFGQGVFQMQDNKPPFAASYLPNNLDDAFNFFTASKSSYATIPAIFWLSVVGFVIAAILIGTQLKQLKLRLWGAAVAAALVVLTHGGILFVYFWGRLTLQYAMRLGIIFLPFLIVLALIAITNRTKIAKSVRTAALVGLTGMFAYVWLKQSAMVAIERTYVPIGVMVGLLLLHTAIRDARKMRLSIVTAVVAMLVYYWPIAGANTAVSQIYIFREFRQVRRFVDQAYPDQNFVLISDLANLYVPFRYSAIRVGRANADPAGTLRRTDRKLKSDLLAVQRVSYASGEIQEQTKLNEEAYQITEVLYETMYNGGQKLRIVKVMPAEGFVIDQPRTDRTGKGMNMLRQRGQLKKKE